jgi:hypothetical protein
MHENKLADKKFLLSVMKYKITNIFLNFGFYYAFFL